MAEVNLSIKFYWKEVEADMSKCCICEEIIYYKMHQGIMDIAGTHTPINSMKVCYSCFDAVNKIDG